jgi:hypothetical protein
MDNRRGYNAAIDEERWLFVGRDTCCPPSPEHRDDPGALFDKVQKVIRRSYDVWMGRSFLNWRRGQLLRWRWGFYIVSNPILSTEEGIYLPVGLTAKLSFGVPPRTSPENHVTAKEVFGANRLTIFWMWTKKGSASCKLATSPKQLPRWKNSGYWHRCCNTRGSTRRWRK